MDNPEKIRINKYMAMKGLCSRREADALIKAGRVKLNGRPAVLGDKVGEGDEVTLGGGAPKSNLVYVAYNKPVGIVTHSPVEGEQEINDILSIKEKVYPLGRLDKASHGLIILTNDGRMTDKLLNPKYYHEKEYVVKTLEPLRESTARKLSAGLRIEEDFTKPARVKQLGPNAFSITLTEGKRHQIRRMCAALGLSVLDLKRTRIMNINLGKLKEGEHRYLAGGELSEFLGSLGITNTKK